MIVDKHGKELKESFNKKVDRQVNKYMTEVANPVIKDVKGQYEFLATQLHVMTLKYEITNECLTATTNFILSLIEQNKIPPAYRNTLVDLVDTVEKKLEYIGARNEQETKQKEATQ